MNVKCRLETLLNRNFSRLGRILKFFPLVARHVFSPLLLLPSRIPKSLPPISFSRFSPPCVRLCCWLKTHHPIATIFFGILLEFHAKGVFCSLSLRIPQFRLCWAPPLSTRSSCSPILSANPPPRFLANLAQMRQIFFILPSSSRRYCLLLVCSFFVKHCLSSFYTTPALLPISLMNFLLFLLFRCFVFAFLSVIPAVTLPV